MVSISDMLAALVRSGHSQATIAERLGTTQATVSRLMHGQGTSYGMGKKIEALYAEIQIAA